MRRIAQSVSRSFVASQQRFAKLRQPIGQQGHSEYSPALSVKAGVDTQIKHTEVYDGYTDDYGVFKEGPPTALRLEYVRSPDHQHAQIVLQKSIWSPFQVGNDLAQYSPFYYDFQGFSSRDYWGHRSGTQPGSHLIMGHYRCREYRAHEIRNVVNHFPQKRVPKWLACIANDERRGRFVGFFLYANGAYCVELLTYKQLPRLVYNKPFQSCIPTLGQTVEMGEVTYGKEVHSIERYPGKGAYFCRSSGTAAVILRGSEPDLVPVLLPSKEIRLIDSKCNAVFGRRAGVMYNKFRIFGYRQFWSLRPRRPRVHAKSKRVHSHPAGGGNGQSAGLVFPLDWRVHPRNNVKTKFWLSGYILRGRQYNKRHSVADLKSKTYSWASRDPVYR